MSRPKLWCGAALFTGLLILLSQIQSHVFWHKPWHLDWQMALVWLILTVCCVGMETRRQKRAKR
ncbi:hypothetical protein [Sphingomonas oryzagri]|uniref:DUF5668 domain-containing protein n=1 Tax=Sphingomonas oryzagri TaxID=3042314 RepID=A0ABT6MYU0_9SPHN|nr:hypothetical protein [Sphingomonas oryzagri]MDH7637967.1 hypothetical protein [Sphingomonas oryzagri]